jgi:hypothetical protein
VAAGILCVVALIPALFLEGRKPSDALVRSIDSDTIMKAADPIVNADH